MFGTTLLSVFLAASSTLAAPSGDVRAKNYRADPQCPIVFDGRVPVGATPQSFDGLGLYNPDYVKGNNLSWSDILLFPKISSRFDGDKYTAVEVTLSDKSIFQNQQGFRRAGLQFIKDGAEDVSSTGVKTLHWSVKQDSERKLNLTHEYLNVWKERADYAANQIQFQAGSLIGKDDADKNKFKILDRANTQLWSVKIEAKKWQNFAVQLDFNKNQVTIYYSIDGRPLEKVAGPLTADLSGDGQFQLGILKKPTGTDDVVNSGYQSPNLNEGQIYGGVFLEDSADGCVSL